MTRDEIKTVSFAPEAGEVSPFERLCTEFICLEVRRDVADVFVAACVRDFNVEENLHHTESLTTTSGDPIDFQTALELASLHLLARLAENENA